jgi:hypothetical protein
VTDPIQRRSRPPEAFIVAAAGFAVLVLMVWWLDNVHINTTNGLFKSLTVRLWRDDPALATLDRSNYLYFPLMAVLCRLLDLLGVYAGLPWKQLAVVNAAFGAACLGIVFAFVRALTGRRDIALLATLLHGASAFFLILSITNEDILPGYTLVLAAMALAALWFDQPTLRRVAVVGALFTLGWLMEWRLLFPTLPALVLALVLAPLSLRARAANIAVLVLSILLTTEAVALAWDGHNGSGQILQLLWPGKGVDSGWAGFASSKFALLVAGVGQYLLGGRNVVVWTVDSRLPFELAVSSIVQLVLLVSVLRLGWRAPAPSRVRAVLAVFIGTFAAGEVLNLYSQPQDPQMQINVMPWLTVAWALVLAHLLPPDARPLWRGGALALPLAVLAYNMVVLVPERGRDSLWRGVVGELERNTAPERTVFLYHGFEGIVSWQNLMWAWRWSGACDLAPAPAAQPRFKWIGVTHSLVQHPERSAADHASALRREIDCALDKGYRVITRPIWEQKTELDAVLTTLNAAQHVPTLQKTFLDNYTTVPAFTTSVGLYLEVRRR